MPTFCKAERMTSLKEVERLFERGHNSSVQAWPLRAVYRCPEGSFVSKSGCVVSKSDSIVPKSDSIVPKSGCAAATPPAKVLISVAKKRLRHAVDRNRAKRQIREAYRLHKQFLTDTLTDRHKAMNIAFIWLANEPMPTDAVFKAMEHIVNTISRKQQSDLDTTNVSQDNK